MIKEKKVKSKEKTVYIAELDGTKEECESEALAKSKIKEWEEIKTRRLKDFLIAEKLMGFVWMNFFDHNYLVEPHIAKDRFLRNDEIGRKEENFISGILRYSMMDEGWHPPEYDKSEQFLGLYAALVKRFINVKFYISDRYITCELTSDGQEAVYSRLDRKQKYWSNEYLMSSALKDAAAEWCAINIK